MLNKKTRARFYQKAPAKFLLKKASGLKKLAIASFVFSLVFMILSNPFFTLAKFKDLPNVLSNSKDIISNIPEFIKNLPQETEKNTFAFFDWTKMQLDNSWPIFARETVEESQEAGQSALAQVMATPDYADLPFYIEIPSLEIYEEVHANINPNKPAEYKAALETGVAHARNSAFPGQDKLIYIFGHSTNGIWNVEAYNAVFYQIKDLELGEQIILHLGEEKFVYRVSAQDIIQSSEVDFVNNLKDENILLLQTCWPPGTSWQRLFVSAVPVLSE
jgi:LPXTG-site transpeptidase (sortase) family protein